MLRKLFNSSLFHLNSVNRYSGVYLVRPENVSEHTTAVGIIAIYIGNLINKSTCYDDDKVSLEKVALKALVHDIEEALICDIPRPVKYYNSHSEELFNTMSDYSVLSLSNQINFNDLYSYWKLCKDQTIEGIIVKVADMLHVVKKVVDEICFLKNMHMLKVSIEVLDHLIKLSRKIEFYDIPNVSKKVLTDLINESVDMLRSINREHSEFFDRFDIVNHKTIASSES